MNNLETLMETADDIKISKKEKKYIMQETVRILGLSKELTNAIEEISELINVLSSNILGEYNKLNTAEEVVDVIISIRLIELATGIYPSNTEMESEFDGTKIKTFEYFYKLSKAQQYISKYIRYGSLAKNRLSNALFLMQETVEDIITSFSLNDDILNKIELLKYKRIQDKIKYNNLK